MQKTELLWIAETTKALLEKGESDTVVRILSDVIHEAKTKKNESNNTG